MSNVSTSSGTAAATATSSSSSVSMPSNSNSAVVQDVVRRNVSSNSPGNEFLSLMGTQHNTQSSSSSVANSTLPSSGEGASGGVGTTTVTAATMGLVSGIFSQQQQSSGNIVGNNGNSNDALLNDGNGNNNSSSSASSSNTNNNNNNTAGSVFPSIGNGFGNINDGNSIGIAPGSAGTFDLSDFPSLGVSVSAGPSPATTSTANAAAIGNTNTNGLGTLLRQQQMIAAQQQQQQMLSGGGSVGSAKVNVNPGMYQRMAMSNAGGTGAGPAGNNFHMAAEDFPALPGAPQAGLSLLQQTDAAVNGAIAGHNSTSYLTNDRSVSMQPGAQPPGSNTPVRTPTNINFSADLDIGLPNPSSLTLQPSHHQTQLPSSSSQHNNPHSQQQGRNTITLSSANSASSSTTTAANTAAGSALSGDYGLLGLLGVIRMSDADRNALALGSDLTTLGLNLNSSEHLYSTFAGPWSDAPTTREPQYQLPMCYYMQPPALKTGHLSKFQLETLFYIFYALPKDVLQAYAAQELYAREWKFHVDLKLWFKRASPADGVPVSTMQYIYFDINTWERRMFNSNMNSNVTNGLLPEDDVRVKFTNS